MFPGPHAVRFLVLALAIVLCQGCGGNEPPTTTPPQQLQPAQGGRAETARPSSPATSRPTQPANPPIPADARWTLHCATFTGPDHAASARQARVSMLERSGMRDWHLMQSADYTTLYYGYYRAIEDSEDPREAARVRADRRRLMAITGPAGQQLFPSVIVMPLEGADPPAPAEWNLANARGYWSLQVAAFRDDPRRKQAAVDAVREARAQGIEAYFHHGPSASSVCIGVFPREAVRVVEEVRATDSTSTVVVVPSTVPLPSGQIVGRDGRPIEAHQARQEILDPRLRALKEEFKYLSVNGQEGVRIRTPEGRIREIRWQSFLVTVGAEEEPAPAPAAQHLDPLQNAPPVDPWRSTGGGRLRSID